MTSTKLARHKTLFIVYGSSSCPYCKILANFLKEEYGEEKVVFCDTKNDPACDKLYDELVELIDFQPLIPLTCVVRDNRVVAIIQGAVLDKGYWDKVLENPPDPPEVFIRKVIRGVGRIEKNTRFDEEKIMKIIKTSLEALNKKK